MGKKDDCINKLKGLENRESWEEYLLKNSDLPGPRANLELLYAVAEYGTEEQFRKWIHDNDCSHPPGDPREFIAACGTAGLGHIVTEKRDDLWALLMTQANDTRWRVREAVAMALQFLGDRDMPLLLYKMKQWAEENMLVQRAVMAALCEPRLLKRKENALRVLHILDGITKSLLHAQNTKSEEFRVLRQALGYGWSVVVVACPEEGLMMFNKLEKYHNKDIDWIIKENRKKKRMIKLIESLS